MRISTRNNIRITSMLVGAIALLISTSYALAVKIVVYNHCDGEVKAVIVTTVASQFHGCFPPKGDVAVLEGKQAKPPCY